MENKKWYQKSWGIILLLYLFFPVGLFLMWKYSNWNKIVKIIITSIFAFLFIIIMFAGDTETPNNIDNENTTVLSSVSEQENTTDEISTTQESTTLNETTTDELTTTQTPNTTKETTTTTTPQTQSTTQETNPPQETKVDIEEDYNSDENYNSENTNQENSRTVYITPTGEKYHCSSACAGKNAIAKKYSDVEGIYGPCKKCAY